VRMRNRKPCVLARRRLFGWKVRLLTRKLHRHRCTPAGGHLVRPAARPDEVIRRRGTSPAQPTTVRHPSDRLPRYGSAPDQVKRRASIASRASRPASARRHAGPPCCPPRPAVRFAHRIARSRRSGVDALHPRYPQTVEKLVDAAYCPALWSGPRTGGEALRNFPRTVRRGPPIVAARRSPRVCAEPDS
jgi:hypothetical protein